MSFRTKETIIIIIYMLGIYSFFFYNILFVNRYRLSLVSDRGKSPNIINAYIYLKIKYGFLHIIIDNFDTNFILRTKFARNLATYKKLQNKRNVWLIDKLV